MATQKTSYITAAQYTTANSTVSSSTTQSITPVTNADLTGALSQTITLNNNTITAAVSGSSEVPAPLKPLQQKAQNPYSNKQFVSPVSLKLNVEGVYKDIDLLQKQISTSYYNPYKRNIALAINSSQIIRSGVTQIRTKDRTSRQLTTHMSNKDVETTITQFAKQENLTQSIFDTSNNAISKNLTTRLPADLQGVAANPAAAIQSTASKLNLTKSLPSASLGSLTDVFKVASSVASSGPPSSISGAIALEQQVKEIVCNFTPPSITIPPLDQLYKLKGSEIKKQIEREIKHELQMLTDPLKKLYAQMKEFFKPENIKKYIADLLPDPNELLQDFIDEFTKCNKQPNSKRNDLSGQTDKPAPATPPTPTVTPPDVGASYVGSGFGSAFTPTNNVQTFGSAFNTTGTTQTFGSSFTSTGAKQSFGSAGPGSVPAPGTK